MLAALVAMGALLTGCGIGVPLSAEERVAVQEEQLAEMVAQADGWGAEIIAQVPSAEIELISESAGGARQVSDYEEWPKYYYWDPIIVLRADGARTPTEVADDLEPWLKAQGWERNEDSEFPPGQRSFERDYYREGYHLVVEVYTVPPPHAQKLALMIVTPETDPDRP
jgi:hypothetical protein